MYRDKETLSYEVMGEEHYAQIDREREDREALDREEAAEVQDEPERKYTEEELDALEARLHAMEIRDYGRPITTIERQTARIREIREEMAADLTALDQSKEEAA
jgi:hypothetical protein